MKVVGNSKVWKKLLADLPSVALLRGPSSVGKRSCGQAIARKVSPDCLVLESLLAPDAEKLVKWASHSSPRKIAIVSPAKSSPSGWNRLLKTLEELPHNTYVWIVDEGDTPMTIRTRAVPYEFEPLTTDEVMAILARLGTIEDEESKLLRAVSPTSVSDALKYCAALSKSSSVTAWLAAIAHASREELLASVAGWNHESTYLLKLELDRQYERKSLFGVPLHQLPKESFLQAISLASRQGPPSVSALVAGFRLLDRT